MKNNKVIITAVVMLVILLGVLIYVVCGLRDLQPADPTVASDTRTGLPTVDTKPVQPMDGTDPATEQPTTEQAPSETVTQPSRPTEPPVKQPTKPSDNPVPEVTVPAGVHFPYTIPGTELVIEAVNPYSGIFLEDGSDREAQNVCAIILRNRASTCAEYVNITLTRDDGKQLLFVASAVDAGASVVVMESNAAAYQETDYSDCTAKAAQIAGFEMSKNQIRVEENDSGALVVTNISGKDIPCVRIFYKFYMEDVDVYIGGITYTAKIENLAAGEARTVMPSHYAVNNSRIVMVKVYQTTD